MRFAFFTTIILMLIVNVSCQIEEDYYPDSDSIYSGNPEKELPDSSAPEKHDNSSDKKFDDDETSEMDLIENDRENRNDSSVTPDNEVTDNEVTDDWTNDSEIIDESSETPDTVDAVSENDETVETPDNENNSSGDITLVINEIDYENYGSAPEDKQFIEIYNYGSSPVDLSDIKLYFSTIDSVTDEVVFQKVDLDKGSSVSTTDHMTGTIEEGGYILIHKGWDTASVSKFTCQHKKVFTNILKSSTYGTGAIALVQVNGNNGTLIDSVSYNGCMNNVQLPAGSFTSPEMLNGTFNLCETEGTGSDLDQNYLSLSRVTNGHDTENNRADFRLAKPSSPCAENLVVPDNPETLLNGDFQDTSFEHSYDSARPNYHFKGWVTSSYVQASNGGEYPYTETSLLSLTYSGAYTRWIVRSHFRCGNTVPYEMTFKMKGSGAVLFELSSSKADRFYVLDNSDGTFHFDESVDSKNLSSYTSFDRTIMSSMRVSFGDLSGFCESNDVITFSLWTKKDVPVNLNLDNFTIR